MKKASGRRYGYGLIWGLLLGVGLTRISQRVSQNSKCLKFNKLQALASLKS